MSMSTLQILSTIEFVGSVHLYRHMKKLPGCVGSMLPIAFTQENQRGEKARKVLSPDAFLARVADHHRASDDLAVEKVFPAFVLEVVSPSSATRDEGEKVQAYEALGAEEYALFTLVEQGGSILRGHRRDAAGRFVPWQTDEAGRLWSEVLELWLVTRDELLLAETQAGLPLRTWEQTEQERQRAETAARQEAARERAEQIAQEECSARERAEQIAQEERAARERIEAEREAERTELAQLRARLHEQENAASQEV